MIRNNKIFEAIDYMRKQSTSYQFSHFNEIKFIMGLLVVYDKIDEFPEYKEYFNDDKWDKLI